MTTSEMLYINDAGKWVAGPAPVVGDTVTHRVSKNFSQICLYYANIIDYVRLAMAVVAFVVTLHAPEWKLSIAALLMGSVLLDWVDGPVARYYGQSTVIGCGFDWLADLFAQYGLAVWCMQVGTPITTFVVLFTAVEMSAGLFDFAVSATSVYPSQSDTSKLPWYAIVEHWLTPNQSYNKLGIVCWLANTAFPISYCIGAPAWSSHVLAPFAYLYAWHEVCQLVFILENWQETSAKLNSGVDFMRMCKPAEVTLLTDVLAQTKEHFLPAMAATVPGGTGSSGTSGGAIVWFNIFHNGKFEAEYALRATLDMWVHDLLREFYPKPRTILSYGFINSPRRGGSSQGWHYDYAPTVSNLFVPMTLITHRNATQFVRGALKTPMPTSNYFPEPHVLLDDEGVTHMEVSQVVCKPFAILKLFPSIMHRGIANGEDYDRLLFFVSTNDTELDIGEGYVVAAQSEQEIAQQIRDEEAKKGN